MPRARPNAVSWARVRPIITPIDSFGGYWYPLTPHPLPPIGQPPSTAGPQLRSAVVTSEPLLSSVPPSLHAPLTNPHRTRVKLSCPPRSPRQRRSTRAAGQHRRRRHHHRG